MKFTLHPQELKPATKKLVDESILNYFFVLKDRSGLMFPS